jgi:hypothetical protein
VREPEDAAAFCERLGLPVYDAQVIGYPQRMRDYDRRQRTGASDSLDETIADLERRLADPDPDA